MEGLWSEVLMRSVFLAVFLVASFAVAAQAKPIETGVELRDTCASLRFNDDLFCKAYIAAVYDTLSGLYEANGKKKPFCVPPDTGLIEIHRNVSAWLKSNTVGLRFSGAFAVFKALSAFYPCKKGI